MRSSRQQILRGNMAFRFPRRGGLSISFRKLVKLERENTEGQPAYETEPFTNHKEITQEMGDCLFSILCLCSCLGLDAQDALELALQKYEERFVEKGHVGSGKTI